MVAGSINYFVVVGFYIFLKLLIKGNFNWIQEFQDHS